MLQNAYLLAKIGADTAENDRNFAEILPKIGNYPTGPRFFGTTCFVMLIACTLDTLLNEYGGGSDWVRPRLRRRRLRKVKTKRTI